MSLKRTGPPGHHDVTIRPVRGSILITLRSLKLPLLVGALLKVPVVLKLSPLGVPSRVRVDPSRSLQNRVADGRAPRLRILGILLVQFGIDLRLRLRLDLLLLLLVLGGGDRPVGSGGG